MSRIDVEAVRITKDGDILLNRESFAKVLDALQGVGFVYRHTAGVDMFLDGPQGSPRSAIQILFAQQRVAPEYVLPTPSVSESEPGPGFPGPTLEALVRMKLTAFQLKDKVHLLDLLDVGLIDESWRDRLVPELSQRLAQLLAERDQ